MAILGQSSAHYPRSTRAQRTYKRILDAAMESFAQSGFSGARIDEIASRAGTNKRMIYAYFGSKSELYQAVIHDIDVDMDDLNDVSITSASAFIEEVRRLFDVYFNFITSHPKLMRLMLWESLEQEGQHNILDHIYRRLTMICHKIYKQAQDIGILQRVYSEREIAFLALMTHGIFYAFFSRSQFIQDIWGKNFDDQQIRSEFVDHYLGMLGAGILKLDDAMPQKQQLTV